MRIAAAQTRTPWGDRAKTADIVTSWIAAAAQNGVELLAFGETFLVAIPSGSTSLAPAPGTTLSRSAPTPGTWTMPSIWTGPRSS